MAIVLAILFLPFTSCSEEDVTCKPEIIEKEFSIDMEDNLIKLNGIWLSNSNYDYSNWEYFQEIGWKSEDNNFWIYVDPIKYEIISLELINYPFVCNSNFFSNNLWYYESSCIYQIIPDYPEVAHFKIKLKKLN